MAQLAEQTLHNGGFVTRAELTSFTIAPGETRRLADASRGIWNPEDVSATLSVVSSPHGPYSTVKSRTNCSTTRIAQVQRTATTPLERAYELELPIILLRKIGTGTFMPTFTSGQCRRYG